MAISDIRGKRINEIISGIKIIKFNAWERIFNRLISKYRTSEAYQIWKTFTLYNLAHASSSFIPTVLGIVTFTLYELKEGRQLDVATIYKLVTLFNSTLLPIKLYIMGIASRVESKAASSRINKLI